MKCHICDQETVSFLHEKSGIHYHHCQSCEYIFKDPVNYQDIHVQKVRYDLHTNDEEDTGYRAYFQRFVDFVLPRIQGVRKVLDFGCGKSRLLANILKDMNMQCDAYDPIYHPIKLSDSKKYDMVVSTEVFEHLHQPREVFGQLVSMLKKGGYLAIQTQFHPNDHDAFKTWYYHHDPTHVVFFRPHTFEVLAKLHGCDLLADNGKNMVVLKKSNEDTGV